MFSWLMEQTLLLSLVCSLLLISHRFLLSQIGAHYTYSLWAIVPLLPLADVLQTLLPQYFTWLSPNQALGVIQQYYVLATDTASMSSSVFKFLYLPYLYAAVLLALVVHLVSVSIHLQRLTWRAKPLAIESGKLNVLIHPSIQSPMLVGLIVPKILVPNSFALLDSHQRQAIIQHELYHYQRGDLWANVLAYSLTMMFWFNPLMWLAYRRFRQDQELSCDAQVTATMETDSKIAYSKALLAYSQHAPLSMLHTHYGDKTILKERILQMKKQHGKNTLVLMGVTLLLSVSALTLNQQAQAGDSQNHTQAKADGIYPTIRIEPTYPIEAAKEGVNGYVQLSFDINPTGKVSNVIVTKSSPAGVFDDSALAALKQWEYQRSAKGQKGAQVQLDFVIHLPDESVERIQVR
ncbi:M56 family metallopeptidase [Shewanella sp. OMA3-2]|uniref:M56 family metallopeptidase n=1 Tax=Shewanella sp. OMA3-2 TaxID=2908650 RepID=UPI001F2B95AB|nr:M56 family metallopeptidase [Shewanella sp. OMA3-2]UJF22642.1 M56 family metallopeptidase [Shewanella sp. OMA3-2]